MSLLHIMEGYSAQDSLGRFMNSPGGFRYCHYQHGFCGGYEAKLFVEEAAAARAGVCDGCFTDRTGSTLNKSDIFLTAIGGFE